MPYFGPCPASEERGGGEVAAMSRISSAHHVLRIEPGSKKESLGTGALDVYKH